MGVGGGGLPCCCSLHFITCVHLRNQTVTQWIDFILFYIYLVYYALKHDVKLCFIVGFCLCVCVFLLGASGHPESFDVGFFLCLKKSISQHVSKIFQTASFYPPFILCPFTLILVTLTHSESLNWKLFFLNNFLANQFCTMYFCTLHRLAYPWNAFHDSDLFGENLHFWTHKKKV